MKKLWNKIKLVWKGRKIATDLINIKSKWKEPTFWASLLSNGITALASAQGMIPPEYAKVAIWANALLTSAYNGVRSYQKAMTDGVTPYKSSSEIIVGLLSIANGVFINAQAGGVADEWLAPAIMMTGGAMVAGRDTANMRPKEVAEADAADAKTPSK
jgi:hypothetical protein